MADQNDPRSTGVTGTPVPDLIERYRLRRDAWIAQADELARLRDEVRGAAEREAMEIVTTARRDVRQVIMEARRELLVLSAQVQAALGEVSGKDPAALISRATGATLHPPSLPPGSSPEHAEEIIVPEAAVKSMLDEARADMEALAADAKSVPFQATLLGAPQEKTTLTALKEKPALAASHEKPTFAASTILATPLEGVPVPKASSLLAPEFEDELDLRPSVMFESVAALGTPAPEQTTSSTPTRVLLTSPYPSDAVPVPQGRSVRAFVALFVVVGAAVLGGSYWWLRAHAASPSPSTEANARPAAPSTTAAAPPTSLPTAPSSPASPVVAVKQTSSAPLSILVEARRESWIRTTRDGESDLGRTYAAGEKVQLTAERGISVRAGNAGAVYVSVNKGEPKPLGRDGEVITRQFVPDAPSTSRAAAPAVAAPIAAVQKPPVGPSHAPPSTASAATQPPIAGPLIQPPAPTPAAASPSPAPVVAPSPAPAVARNEPPTVALPRTEAATAPPPAPSPVAAGGGAVSPASAVVAAARQWLDAYHRQERSTMAALSIDTLQLADERRADERFPANVEVNRSLDRVSVQIAADTAVLTAVMTERGEGSQKISPVSQVWVLSSGQWRVKQVRLVSEARLNQIFR
jgi:RodZ C-terminal domain